MSLKAHHIHTKPTRQVGFVLKPHGFSGQLRLSLEEDFLPEGFLFLQIHGKFVPFAIEHFNEDAGIVKLQGYDSVEKASELLSLPVLELLETKEDTGPADLSDYTLRDIDSGREYEITGVLEYPGNVLLEFRCDYKDCLLPMHDDLICEIRHEEKLVLARFPEGLLDL